MTKMVVVTNDDSNEDKVIVVTVMDKGIDGAPDTSRFTTTLDKHGESYKGALHTGNYLVITERDAGSL